MSNTLNRFSTALAALMAAVLLSAGPAAAQGGERRGQNADSAERQMGRMARVLQLTDDQQEEWRTVHEQHGATIRGLMTEVRDLRQRLDEEAESAAPDATTVGQLELDRRAVGKRLAAAREALSEDLEALLDHDQRIRWETMRESGPGRRGGPRGRGPNGRGPGGPGG